MTATLIANTAVSEDVRALLSRKLRRDCSNVPGHVTLSEIGFDSLALSDLAEAIEERFDLQVPQRTFPETLTIDQLIVLLATGLHAKNHNPAEIAIAHAA
jgi:acyl carrier protein